MAIMCNGLHISSDSPGITVDKSLLSLAISECDGIPKSLFAACV
jgi:hypothetical protein